MTLLAGRLSLWADDCAAILNVGLERLEFSSEEQLDQAAVNYYSSESFAKDYRKKEFSGNVIVEGIPLGANASDQELHEWQSKISTFNKSKLSVTSKQYFIQTRGLSTLAEAWLDCKNNRISMKANPKQGEGDAGEYAVVDFSFPTPGVNFKVIDFTMVDCKQVPTEGAGGKVGLTKDKNVTYPGFLAKFRMKKDAPAPYVVVKTSIGSSFAGFKGWPPHRSPPPPPWEFFEETIYVDEQKVTIGLDHVAGDRKNFSGGDLEVRASIGIGLRKSAQGVFGAYLIGQAQYHETGGDQTTDRKTVDILLKEFPKAFEVELVPANPSASLSLTEAPGSFGNVKAIAVGHPASSSSNMVKRWEVRHYEEILVFVTHPIKVKGKRYTK